MFNTRRYLIDLFSGLAIYAVLLFGSIWTLQRTSFPPALQIVIAIIPMLGALVVTAAVLKHWREMDEMMRRIQIEAFAVAAIIVALGCFTLGFLENAGFERVSMIWVFPAQIGLWGLVAPIVRRRYS